MGNGGVCLASVDVRLFFVKGNVGMCLASVDV